MEATGTKNVNFLKCNLESLAQYMDQKEDILICSSVLEYIENLDSSLDLIWQTMNVDGVFLFSMPNKKSLYRKVEALSYKLFRRPKYYKYVKNVYTLNEIINKLKSFVFSTVEYKHYGETPFLSGIFRKMGVPQYSDNLFVIVARSNSDFKSTIPNKANTI
jgi:2-polyprenyl-3-methyl-5-hydroxy-6-metoxy-1,4-benzoquinol methylase